MVFIYGDSFKDHIVAIVYPEEETLKRWCTEKNISKIFNFLNCRMLKYEGNGKARIS